MQHRKGLHQFMFIKTLESQEKLKLLTNSLTAELIFTEKHFPRDKYREAQDYKVLRDKLSKKEHPIKNEQM
ncbi:hypothetical protein CDAR_607101 [Caerostris darwini]|uniref:Ribosomal protein L33 n=1 Tax=Caerostris darwini TaxID=1538125 RepID=A0AAV4TIG0_9ARAC|nr:hypothetical protein CDAR_607101 [Caerostris darwini]